MVCQEAGLELCSGGIVGQGETDEDIVDMLLALQELDPKSVPINFLIPVGGTPFAQIQHKLTPIRCLKVLAVARLIHPTAELRVAGGREYHLRSLQPMALFLVNSMFVNGYLTEGGQGPDETFRMIRGRGLRSGRARSRGRARMTVLDPLRPELDKLEREGLLRRTRGLCRGGRQGVAGGWAHHPELFLQRLSQPGAGCSREDAARRRRSSGGAAAQPPHA